MSTRRDKDKGKSKAKGNKGDQSPEWQPADAFNPDIELDRFFVPGEGIERRILQARIQKLCGPEALCAPCTMKVFRSILYNPATKDTENNCPNLE